MPSGGRLQAHREADTPPGLRLAIGRPVEVEQLGRRDRRSPPEHSSSWHESVAPLDDGRTVQLSRVDQDGPADSCSSLLSASQSGTTRPRIKPARRQSHLPSTCVSDAGAARTGPARTLPGAGKRSRCGVAAGRRVVLGHAHSRAEKAAAVTTQHCDGTILLGDLRDASSGQPATSPTSACQSPSIGTASTVPIPTGSITRLELAFNLQPDLLRARGALRCHPYALNSASRLGRVAARSDPSSRATRIQ
jgi:hypothetical protein